MGCASSPKALSPNCSTSTSVLSISKFRGQRGASRGDQIAAQKHSMEQPDNSRPQYFDILCLRPQQDWE